MLVVSNKKPYLPKVSTDRSINGETQLTTNFLPTKERIKYMTIELTERERQAVLFALKADLATVEGDIEEFAGDDEVLRPVIARLEAVVGPYERKD